MYYAIANPYWYVPEHLVRKVAANVSKQGPAYLKARGYEVDYSPGVVLAQVAAIVNDGGWLQGAMDGRTPNGKAAGY